MQDKDYYAVLGVTKSATDKEIKSAYRKMARQYHPDLNPGDSKAESKFQDINEAYETLSDTEKRQQYDQFGSSWKQAGNGAGGAGRRGGGGGQPFDFDFSGVDFGGGGGAGMGDLFEQMFGKGRGRRPAQGGHARADIEVSLEEAYSGTQKTLTLTQQKPCPACGGQGVTRGGVCHVCGGGGKRSEDSKLEVKIPAGVNEGSKIRIKGKGEPGAMGGAPGDLYLTVHLRKHPDYEVKGRDLYKSAKLDMFTAVLGGTIDVETFKGTVELKIPAGTQGGAKFRLGGFGLPGSGGKSAGNLYVEVAITVPEKLTETQREQFATLKTSLAD